MNNKNIEYPKFEFDFFMMKQPIGEMFCSLIPAETIIKISASETRSAYNDLGVQRRLDPKRVKDIAVFCEHSDAMFPTPIVISANSANVTIENETHDNDKELVKGKIIIDYDTIRKNNKFFGVIDGQHRLKGIEASGLAAQFELIVLFVFDVDVGTEARLFSIINGKQKPISKSLIYDLERLNNIRTVEKVCSETVDYLNEEATSKLYHQIKMLGYKEHENSLISQSALVHSMISLITKDIVQDNLSLDKGEKLNLYSGNNPVLRSYFIKEEDAKIKKIMLNYLNAWIRNLEDLGIIKSLIGKTIGFNAALKLFPEIVLRLRGKTIMSEENFYEELYSIFNLYIQKMNIKKQEDESEQAFNERKQKEIKENISNYGSSQSGSNKLAYDLIEVYKKL